VSRPDQINLFQLVTLTQQQQVINVLNMENSG
jgi:hypothetical protein